jgi:hypothetical protein
MSKFKVEVLYALIGGLTNPNSPKDVLDMPTILGVKLTEL